MTTRDIDALMYEHEEAAHLRRVGWTVEPPKGERWAFSRCIGAFGKACPVRTANRRCHYCNRTIKLRIEERRRARLRVVA